MGIWPRSTMNRKVRWNAGNGWVNEWNLGGAMMGRAPNWQIWVRNDIDTPPHRDVEP